MTERPIMPSLPGTIVYNRWPLVVTRTLIYVIRVAIVIVEAFPLMWMIVTSIKDSHEIFNTILPTEIKWQTFPRVWVSRLYRAIVTRLVKLGIRREDIFVAVHENSYEDWYSGQPLDA